MWHVSVHTIYHFVSISDYNSGLISRRSSPIRRGTRMPRRGTPSAPTVERLLQEPDPAQFGGRESVAADFGETPEYGRVFERTGNQEVSLMGRQRVPTRLLCA